MSSKEASVHFTSTEEVKCPAMKLTPTGRESKRQGKIFALNVNTPLHTYEALTVPTYRTMGSFVKGTGGSLRPSGRLMTSIPPGHLEV